MGGAESSEKRRQDGPWEEPRLTPIRHKSSEKPLRQAESSEKPRLTLRLLVDKKREKVVLAEAGKDFVDVLFSLLTLPMGTIVRLLKKHKQDQMSQGAIVGCFNNLYKSVVEMDISYFSTEACKDMLLHPRSLKEEKCRRLKLNIDDSDVLKYYMCPNSEDKFRCSKAYSNFCSSRCSCGALMRTECRLAERVEADQGEIFVSGKTSFIISYDMKVQLSSIGVTMRTLRSLGCTDVDKLEEMVVNVTTEEVLALLDCLFSSKTPLTDVFLRKQNSSVMTRTPNMPSLTAQRKTLGTWMKYSVNLFLRKQDKKVLYAESNEDFVDLLFTFLVVPLEFVWELSGSGTMLGCIGNLYQSFQSLSFTKRTHASTSRYMLPWYYSCQRPLLDICYIKCPKQLKLRKGSQIYVSSAMDPKSDCITGPTVPPSSGFVKKGTTFLISSDLTITASNSSSTVCLLKKLDTNLDDIEEQVISISEAEAMSLLRASLLTSTPLTTALGSLLLKKPKLERV